MGKGKNTKAMKAMKTMKADATPTIKVPAPTPTPASTASVSKAPAGVSKPGGGGNRKAMLLKMLNSSATSHADMERVQKKQAVTKSAATPAATPSTDGLSAMQQKMAKKLKGSRFRWLNEQLYTTTGKEAFALIQEDPKIFQEYHDGFRSQVESWPVNPLDVYIQQLKGMGKGLVVADMGCGEARLAAEVPQKVHSFDLVAANERITACDISRVPLKKESVDVVVFCLSLMGTNFLDFLREAWRILKGKGGVLKVAEVFSRFIDQPAFIRALQGIGFKLKSKDESNKVFVLFEFAKVASGKGGEEDGEELLRPCLYKKR